MRFAIGLLTAWVLVLLQGFTNVAEATPPPPAGGCPVHPSPAVATEYEVLRSVELATAIPETASMKVPQNFLEVN